MGNMEKPLYYTISYLRVAFVERSRGVTSKEIWFGPVGP